MRVWTIVASGPCLIVNLSAAWQAGLANREYLRRRGFQSTRRDGPKAMMSRVRRFSIGKTAYSIDRKRWTCMYRERRARRQGHFGCTKIGGSRVQT